METGRQELTAFAELERAACAALERYSNVHRGTGHHSIISTELYERARDIVLEHLGLDRKKYIAFFCTPRRLKRLESHFGAGSELHTLSSRDIGLPLGIRVLAAKRRDLPGGVPFETGGGTIKMVNPNSVVWADAPDKFEAGTPNIVGVIVFARALQIIKLLGDNAFKERRDEVLEARNIIHDDELSCHSGEALLHELRKALVGRNACVPTSEGERPYINFDNAASTPTFYPILNAVYRTWRQPEKLWAKVICEVKRICADFLGAPPEDYDIIFTSNTTEGINIVAESLTDTVNDDTETVILNTLLEHNSNELPWRYVPGVSTLRLPVDSEGFVDLDRMEKLLRDYNHNKRKRKRHRKKRIRVVTVSGASNVLGAFNDIESISSIAHEYGARVLVDAAQLAGHRKIEMQKCGIDYLAFSGHKMYAPFGSGGLVARKGLLGFDDSKQKEIESSGEENVVGIAAMGKAMDLLNRVGMDVIAGYEQRLTTRALQTLSEVPGVKLFGVMDPESENFHRKGGVISLSIKGVPHNLAAKMLADHGGIGVRSGCFCANLLVKHNVIRISRLENRIANMGLNLKPRLMSDFLLGIVRVSFGIENDESEIDVLKQTVEKITREPVSFVNRVLALRHFGTPFLPDTETQKRIEEFTMDSINRIYPPATKKRDLQ